MARPKKLSDSKLLDTAYTVAAREGFDSFTLRQVAKSADISPAAVIKRFRNKSRLVSLARRHRWNSTLDQFRGARSPEHRGVRGIRQLVRLIAASVDSKRLSEHGRAFGVDQRNPATKKMVAGYFAETRAVLSQLLVEAVEDNELSVADPQKVALVLEALIQGAIFQFAFLSQFGIREHLDEHVTVFLAPYSKRPAEGAAVV